jgi:hypothetical protein
MHILLCGKERAYADIIGMIKKLENKVINMDKKKEIELAKKVWDSLDPAQKEMVSMAASRDNTYGLDFLGPGERLDTTGMTMAEIEEEFIRKVANGFIMYIIANPAEVAEIKKNYHGE